VNFTKEQLKAIKSGKNKDWKRIGDPSAYGGVYESPLNPGKVVKIQQGDYSIYDNEIDKQFRAFLDAGDNVEVPKLGETGFFPDKAVPENDRWINPDSGVKAPAGDTQGLSFIEMDKADFAETEPSRTRSLSKSKALSDLYRKGGVYHNDRHGGNIKFNPKTNKTVVLDYGLAKDNKGVRYSGANTNPVRLNNIAQGLKASGNIDMLELFQEESDRLLIEKNTAIANGNVDAIAKSEAALTDLIQQGENVVDMTDQRIDPVNWTERNQDIPRADAEATVVTKQGPRDWKSKASKGIYADGLTSLIKDFKQQKLTPPKISPRAAFAQGASLGLPDLIPSAETIRATEREGIGAGARQFAGEALMGLPVAAGAGLVTQAVPAIAPVMPGVAGGFLLTEGARSLNELSRATTGETLLSKARQAIGTEERTGYSTPGSSLKEQIASEAARVDNPPVIQRAGTNPVQIRRGLVKDAPFPDLAHRLRLAGDRFNPSKFEFGLTEHLFGR